MKSGYTLIELLAVVSIVGVMATVAIPSMATIIKSDRVIVTANQLMSTFKFARSEAVKRESDIQLIKVDETWVVQLDGNTIMTFESQYDSVKAVGLANITIRSSGESNSIQVSIEDGDSDTEDKCFEVLVSGQSQLIKGACTNDA